MMAEGGGLAGGRGVGDCRDSERTEVRTIKHSEREWIKKL